MYRKTFAAIATVAALGGGLAAAPAHAAAQKPARGSVPAACGEENVKYTTGKGTRVFMPLNKYMNSGIWRSGGATVSYTSSSAKDSATAKAVANSAGGSAGADFGIGSATASYNRTWGSTTTASTSHSTSYTATLKLPKARSRGRLYHIGIKFPVTLKQNYLAGPASCHKVHTYKYTVVAPLNTWGPGSFTWDVELYSKRGQVHSA